MRHKNKVELAEKIISCAMALILVYQIDYDEKISWDIDVTLDGTNFSEGKSCQINKTYKEFLEEIIKITQANLNFLNKKPVNYTLNSKYISEIQQFQELINSFKFIGNGK